MLVFGDSSEKADPRERLDGLREQLAAIHSLAPGIDRHAKLVGVLTAAGQLLQGFADADFSLAQMDRRTRTTDELTAFLLELSRAVSRSWESRFASLGSLPALPKLDDLPEQVELRTPEGFAYYAVYPEAYAEAARTLRLSAPARVIGIRSIGTTLAAIVAAELQAPPPITLRPFGDPFARQVALAPELARELLDGEFHYVIVDEGPGQSGSSFGAVADWLKAHGVPLDRIAFVPSHTGDLGPQASGDHRRRWHLAQRVPATFDPGWLERLFGPLREFSTGDPWERRKYLAGAEHERLLLKFAGLGAIGEDKLAMARTLHAAGFTPEPVALVHGFLVERWLGDARPLRPGEKPVDAIGRYIGARARLFPAGPGSGATLLELLEMTRRNVSLALGGGAASSIDRIAENIRALAQRVVPVRTDNKLTPHEWLRTSDGRLIKTDGLDHHQGHDLIGCQDVAWDIAGAAVEFDLDTLETKRLIDSAQCRADPELLGFCRLAYLAFRLGQATLAREHGADRYVALLRDLLHQHHHSATRQQSLVD